MGMPIGSFYVLCLLSLMKSHCSVGSDASEYEIQHIKSSTKTYNSESVLVLLIETKIVGNTKRGEAVIDEQAIFGVYSESDDFLEEPHIYFSIVDNKKRLGRDVFAARLVQDQYYKERWKPSDVTGPTIDFDAPVQKTPQLALQIPDDDELRNLLIQSKKLFFLSLNPGRSNRKSRRNSKNDFSNNESEMKLQIQEVATNETDNSLKLDALKRFGYVTIVQVRSAQSKFEKLPFWLQNPVPLQVFDVANPLEIPAAVNQHENKVVPLVTGGYYYSSDVPWFNTTALFSE